jgi:hypothetical protein
MKLIKPDLIGRSIYPLEEALLLCVLQRLAKRKPSSLSRLVKRRAFLTRPTPRWCCGGQTLSCGDN